MKRRDPDNPIDLPAARGLCVGGCVLAFAAMGLLAGCGQTGSPPPSEDSRVGLALRVERLLDDPSSLPRAVTQLAVGVDAGAGADALDGPAGATSAVAATDPAIEPAVRADAELGTRRGPVEPLRPPTALRKRTRKTGHKGRSSRREGRTGVARTKSARSARSSKPKKPDKSVKPAKWEPEAPPPPPGLDATDLYYLGQRQLQAGQLEAAIRSLSASQKKRPSARTLTRLGQAHFDAGRLKDAERVLKAAGTRAEALILLGRLYLQQGRVAEARKVYRTFLTHHDDHRRAQRVRDLLKTL